MTLKRRKNKSLKGWIKGLTERKASWKDVLSSSERYLYAGDITRPELFKDYYGLSINKNNRTHILHDLNKKFPLPNNCIDRFISEDVFEHIELNQIPIILDEIHRVLKPNGLLRIGLPDYRFDIYKERSFYDSKGNIVFDPDGGGRFANWKVLGGGHVWFPTFETVQKLLTNSKFETEKIQFLHYYSPEGESVTRSIDYSVGHISRTPDNDARANNPYRAMSIVVDVRK